MNATYGPVVPEGQHPPFAVVTPNDHAAWILIPTALGLATLLFFCLLRVLVRSSIRYGFGMDDYILYVATVLAVIQSSIILGACSKGLGKAEDLVSSPAQDDVQKMYYASNLFFILVLGLSKISVVSFLYRTSRMDRHRRAFNIAIVFIAVWTFASLLAIAFQCNLRHAWITLDEKCPGIHRRWQVVGAFDIISEIVIVGLVVLLVYSLQTAMSGKVMVVVIFSFRLFLIIFIGYRLHTFDESAYSRNPFLREAPFIAWTQSEMTYSLISATIPTFQSFLRMLNTGFGGMGKAESGYSYGTGSRSHPNKESSANYQMSTLRSATKSATIEEPDDEQNKEITYPSTTSVEGLHSRSAATTMPQWDGREGANPETTSIGSDESRQMMITKEVQWSVTTEPR